MRGTAAGAMDRPVPQKVAPSSGGMHQRVGNAKTAEPIEMPFRGLSHAGSWVGTSKHSMGEHIGAIMVEYNAYRIGPSDSLSFYLQLTHWSVTLNFHHKSPSNAAFGQILKIL